MSLGIARGLPRIQRPFASSAVIASVTGTLTKTALATIALPALGPNDRVEVWALWSYTNSVNTKTLAVELAGNQVWVQTVTTTQLYSAISGFQNRNATNSQVGIATSFSGGVGGIAAAATTLSVDTSISQNLTITGTLTNTGETITLESYRVVILRP